MYRLRLDYLPLGADAAAIDLGEIRVIDDQTGTVGTRNFFVQADLASIEDAAGMAHWDAKVKRFPIYRRDVFELFFRAMKQLRKGA